MYADESGQAGGTFSLAHLLASAERSRRDRAGRCGWRTDGIGVGLVALRFGFVLVSFWVLFWVRFGCVLVSFWARLGVVLRSCWARLRLILESF